MKSLIDGLVKLLASIFALFTAKQWGKYKAEKELSDKIAKDRSNDAKIGSRPYVDSPFGRMRGRKE